MLSRRDFLRIAAIGTGALLLKGSDHPYIARPKGAEGNGLLVSTSDAGIIYKGRELCFVLWDHQLARYDYKPRNLVNPLPETCPLYSGALNPITPAWEAYWRGILHLCNPNVSDVDFEQSWESLVASDRAFTNSTGPASGNFALHSLTCGGATHEMVSNVPVRTPKGPYLQIYTLNSRKPPPPIPSRAVDIDMTRHFFATTGSNIRLADGSYGVYGFPQFENCIIPLVNPLGMDMIDYKRVKFVQDLQRPFNT